MQPFFSARTAIECDMVFFSVAFAGLRVLLPFRSFGYDPFARPPPDPNPFCVLPRGLGAQHARRVLHGRDESIRLKPQLPLLFGHGRVFFFYSLGPPVVLFLTPFLGEGY